MTNLTNDCRSVIFLHAERLPVGKVQDHPDDSGHKAEHQTPKRSLNKIVKKNFLNKLLKQQC